jgi:hypothetical protein
LCLLSPLEVVAKLRIHRVGIILTALDNASYNLRLLKKLNRAIERTDIPFYFKKTLSVILCHLSCEQFLRAIEFFENSEGDQYLLNPANRSPHNLLSLHKNCYSNVDSTETGVLRVIPKGSVNARYPFSYEDALSKKLQNMMTTWLSEFNEKKHVETLPVVSKEENLNYVQNVYSKGIEICAHVLKCENNLTSVIHALQKQLVKLDDEKSVFANNALFHCSLLFTSQEMLSVDDKDTKHLAAYGVMFYLFPLIEQVIGLSAKNPNIEEVREDTLKHDLLALAKKYLDLSKLSATHKQFLLNYRSGSTQTRYPYYQDIHCNNEQAKFLEYITKESSSESVVEELDNEELKNIRSLVDMTINFSTKFLSCVIDKI